MGPIKQLEKSLVDVSKGLPKLPESAKKVIVKYLPWLSLIGGALTAWAAWSLWHWAHVASVFIDYANSLSRAFGGTEVVSQRMTVGIWLAFGVLVVEAAIYILAFAPLNTKKKTGWNMLFFGSLINILYGVILLFTDYGGFGSLIGALIGTAIAWYFLFQIREHYTTQK
jgi:hypothetical protein